jgi:hypothetical protein
MLAAYKRRAFRSSVEVIVMMFGRAVYKDGKLRRIIVKDMLYPLQEATPDVVSYMFDSVASKYPFLGTIHSHPDNSIIGISLKDIEDSHMVGEILSGIFTWYLPKGGKKRKSRLDWYVNAPCVVVKEV